MVECACPSPIGPLRLISNGNALVGLYFEGHSRPTPPPHAAGRDAVLELAEAQLGEYFRGERDAFDVPVSLQGSAFQLRVWGLLQEIPHGKTRTYLDLARDLELGPESARAVGGAVGANPVSIIVPCHRVIGSDGSITGFAGGVQRKQFLLELEGSAPQRALF